jgi:hypothetical protein
MDQARRDLLVARVISGRTLLRLRGQRYQLCLPSRRDRYYAQEVYAEGLAEGLEVGLWDEGGVLDFLHDRGFWSERDGQALTLLPKDIEKLKVGIYECRFKSEEREKTRQALALARRELEALLARRHGHDDKTCHGHAALMRARYLVGCGLKTWGGKRVFRHEGFWADRGGLLEEAVEAAARARADDAELREVSRTDPWRGVWAARRAEAGVFGKPACDLTEEQRSVVGWSLLYDGARERPECPPDDVLTDDDAFDGWLIKRRQERGGAEASDLIKNEKVRNSQEVFVFADTPEDARRVDALNDSGARAQKKVRLAALRKHGRIAEQDMPDTKARLAMTANAGRAGG